MVKQSLLIGSKFCGHVLWKLTRAHAQITQKSARFFFQLEKKKTAPNFFVKRSEIFFFFCVHMMLFC